MINICICYSPGWAQYVCISVFSIQQTNPGARVYLVSDTAGRMDIPGCEFIDIEGLFRERIPSDVNIDGRFTRFALYRLLLPEIIHDDRLLYIDADALVCGDLSEFYNIDLNGCLIAGVVDTGIIPSQLAECGLIPGDIYINAGVTLMDLANIRAAGLPEVWLQKVNTKYYSCHDQSILCETCKGRIKTIGNEYNSSLSTGFHPQPKIMHWAGPKPWNDSGVVNYHIWKGWADKYAAYTA